MENTKKHKRICNLCGKEIIYTEYTNDGRDWMGHQRGTPTTKIYDYDCGCESSVYKKMCLNCKFYKTHYCTCEDTIKDYNSKIQEDFFDVQAVDTIKIKTPTKHCMFWKISDTIANQIFND